MGRAGLQHKLRKEASVGFCGGQQTLGSPHRARIGYIRREGALAQSVLRV